MSTPKERVIAINKRIVELGRDRRLSDALAQLESLTAQKLRPTAVTFNVLIGAATRCGDNACAARLLTKMRADGLAPNVITYASVLKGLCLSGALDAADELLADAEAKGVLPNERVCTAFLRGCMVWGEVDRVPKFVQRMTSRWNLTLSSTAIEYAGRALCMGLRVDEAEALLVEQQQAAASSGSKSSNAYIPAAQPFQPTAALDLALAEAHASLSQHEEAELRLYRAERRIASGVDTRLHADRLEEAEGEGGSVRGEALQSFLRHREEESRRELARVRAMLSSRRSSSSAGGGTQPASKRQKVGEEEQAAAQTRKQRLKRIEAVYSRVVLLSESTAHLASTPLSKETTTASYGMAPKAMRRFRLAALLVARLDRLGLGVLQRRCGGDTRVAKSEARLIKRFKKCCNASCELRWNGIFGNDQPITLEICAGDGEWSCDQASAHPECNFIACELRGDRIHQITSRLRALELPNLAVLGADAALALKHHARPKCYDSIFVTYPEPPSDHGNADDYLLNASFLKAAHRALRPGGYGLVVVSDNPILLQTVARSLLSLMSDGLGFEGRTGTMGGQPKVQPLHPALIGEASEKLISEGAPKGFVAAGGAQQASRFDRMWASRAKQRRYHVRVVR